jgi:hypothetical protein
MGLVANIAGLVFACCGALPGASDGAGVLPQVTVDGLTVARAVGAAPEIGSAIGTALGARIRFLAQAMGLAPGLNTPDQAQRRADCLAALRPHHRVEIEATAHAAGMAVEKLLTVHLVIETMCSAVAVMPTADRPLRVARNMDYFPADLLGLQTIVQIWSAADLHSVASVGWPGFSGVISGMNDTGLTANILLNFNGDALPAAEPLPLRVRALLETCDSVETFCTAFALSAPASSHYVFVADSVTACVVWWGKDGFHRADPQEGLLVADNEPRTATGEACGERACTLQQLAAQHPDDRDWLRRCTTASFLPQLNAQAMVWEPANQVLFVARGGTWTPAARQNWHRVDLAPMFAGADPTVDGITALGAVEPLPHYADQ